MPRKAVITEADSLLGQALITVFRAGEDWETISLVSHDVPSNSKYTKVDLTDKEAVRKFIQQLKPDVVIHG
jgi:dTDP-4-dehydrorhamnose reductase